MRPRQHAMLLSKQHRTPDAHAACTQAPTPATKKHTLTAGATPRNTPAPPPPTARVPMHPSMIHAINVPHACKARVHPTDLPYLRCKVPFMRPPFPSTCPMSRPRMRAACSVTGMQACCADSAGLRKARSASDLAACCSGPLRFVAAAAPRSHRWRDARLPA